MADTPTPNPAAVVAYLCMPITSGLLLILEKENREVLFHAWQATLFSGGLILIMIVVWLLAQVPYLGTIFGLALPLLFVLFVVVAIVGMVKAYQGERWRLPYIGEIAEKKAGLGPIPPAA